MAGGLRSARPARHFQPGSSAWLLAVLAVLELAWLGWFLVVPLPNFPRESGPMRRGFFLLKALPEVVPETTWGESLVGQAIGELSHLENLPERVPIIAATTLIVAGALGLGELVLGLLRLRDGLAVAERLAADFGVGASVLGVLVLLAGRGGLLGPWIFRIGLGLLALAGAAASGFWRRKWKAPSLDAQTLLPALLGAPFLLVMFLGAMLPAIDFDVLEYHLQGPKEYFLAHRIGFLAHNVYTSMPFGVEMLHLAGMVVLDEWWRGALVGQVLVALYAPAAAVLIASATARLGSRRAGGLAALIYLSTPWIYRMGVIAYVEGPLCFYHAALLWLAIPGGPADRSGPGSRWMLLGLLAGGAMACKYPALISAVLPVGLLAIAAGWSRRSPRPVLAYILGWSIVMAPWLAKNVMDAGNPVYPLAYEVFGGSNWNEARQFQWQTVHGPRQATAGALWNSLVDVAGRSDWQSPLYLAFAPLALLRPGSRRLVLCLWGYAAYLFCTWFLLTHRIDRFWLPLLPCLAILAGLGADWSDRWPWRILRAMVLAVALCCNFLDCSTALTGLNEWTGNLASLRHDLPRRLNPPLAAVDQSLPADARILSVGQAAVFHVEHDILYNTVFNPERIELLARGKTPQEFHHALKERGVTHIYVDWKEIKRHRAPGGYGFTDFVTHELFAAWVDAGVLNGPVPIVIDARTGRFATEQELYPVR